MIDAIFTFFWFAVPSYAWQNYSWVECLYSIIIIYLAVYYLPLFFGLKPMSACDSLMFYETSTNKLVVTSIGIFSEKITLEQYKTCFSRGLGKDEKLISVVVKRLGRYYWKKDKNFNIDNHFIRHTEQVHKSDLEVFMSKIASDSLEFSKPLYELHLFENYESSSAVVFRFHHSIADGLSIGSYVVWCADEGSCKKLYTPKGLSFLKRLLVILLTSLLSPYFLIKFMMKKKDSNPFHKDQLSGIKSISWTEKIYLKGILKHCKSNGLTFNDYLTATVLETLQDYAGCDLGTITANIPVSLVGQPENGDFMKLENNLVVVTTEFPKPSQNLPYECAKIFSNMKNSLDPFVSFYSVKAGISLLPQVVMKNLVFYLVNKATLVFSNAGGPREAVFYCGKKFDRIIPNSPNMANSGISVTAFSYMDHFTIICYSDKAAMKDSHRFLDIIYRKLELVNQKFLD